LSRHFFKILGRAAVTAPQAYRNVWRFQPKQFDYVGTSDSALFIVDEGAVLRTREY
jgi:hypothetical protein